MSEMSSTDVTDELHEAIRTLAEFSRQSEKTTLKPLQKTIDLVRGLILKPDHKVLQAAIEVVNRKRLLIQRLKRAGNPAEQKLAEYFLHTIDGFNASLEQHQSESPGIVKFFLKKEKSQPPLSKIDLPQKNTVHQHYPENSANAWLSRKIASMASTSMINVHLSKQLAELFQMKVIALLERYGIASRPEARSFVKSSPIITSIEEDQSRCTLSQTITLFPGQTVVIKGSSQLNPQTKTISNLFPETFCLLLKSTQTGFPHPSQRNGWTLASELIPESPQRVDLLPGLSSFYQNKKRAIQELLPQGSWVSKAKEVIRLKREAFIENKQDMLKLHKQLTKAIVNAAPAHLVLDNAEKIIDSFYDNLKAHPYPFDFLSDIHQTIADVFITKPHDRLIEVIMEGNASENQTDFSFLNCEEAHQIMTDEIQSSLEKYAVQVLKAPPLERAQLDYIRCLGAILGYSSKAIMLQYFSEDLIFAPPVLNEFERKLQSMAYHHVEGFVEELASEWGPNHLEWASHRIKDQIQQDINHWSTQENNSVADELAEYYTKRYQSPE